MVYIEGQNFDQPSNRSTSHSWDMFHPLFLVKSTQKMLFLSAKCNNSGEHKILFLRNRLYCRFCIKSECLSHRQYNATSNRILTSFPIFEILQLEVHVQQTDRYIQRRTQRTWMNCHSWKRRGKRLKQPGN